MNLPVQANQTLVYLLKKNYEKILAILVAPHDCGPENDKPGERISLFPIQASASFQKFPMTREYKSASGSGGEAISPTTIRSSG